MTYLFNTPDQRQEMLKTIGVASVDELFRQVPEKLRLQRALDLPTPKTEIELEAHVRQLAARNVGISKRVCLLGGGVYDHYIPAAVDEIVSRGEFYTAYTPYQAEASQGSLQAFYEYQSLICRLTGMDVSNASLYEGGTAVSEAAFMAMRITQRHEKVVVLGSLHPEFRQILETYLQHLNCEVIAVPTPNGTADPDEVAAVLDDKTACLIVQHPNFFGCLEQARQLTEIAHGRGALSIVCLDPISLGVIENPGAFGADIAVAEGQSLGIPMQYGGPFLGILACRNEYVRKMPGRLVGKTTDRNGKDCYVLNLQAREQHIRREKATSNICTNQGLLALRATVYLSMLGPAGLKEVANLCCQKAHYAAEQLSQIGGVRLMFDRPFFKEFVLEISGDVGDVQKKAAAAGFDLGPSLDAFSFPAQGRNNRVSAGLLVAVTEKRTRAELDNLVAALGK
ncbi:MAG: aminomethyl-transferring glycine dehydrogenase subunit GcvPA [Planctomycetaceae bacterium]